MSRRGHLLDTKRLVLKAGTSTVTNDDGSPSLTRLANIVENACRIYRKGVDIVLVTSGAVGIGRQRLRKQTMLRRSLSSALIHPDDSHFDNNSPSVEGEISHNEKYTYDSACAAAGQMGLFALYETLFSQYDVCTSQLLVTSQDFLAEDRRQNLERVLLNLLKLGIVPILNENDAVSNNEGYALFDRSFSDNDSLASLVSRTVTADTLLLLTDVDGIYDRDPRESGAQLLHTFAADTEYTAGEKSSQGRGGISAKVNSAVEAVQGGVKAVVVANGTQIDVIEDVMAGKMVGTMFVKGSAAANVAVGSLSGSQDDGPPSGFVAMSPELMAKAAKEGSLSLQLLSQEERKDILIAMADELAARSSEIMDANLLDLKEAEQTGLSGPLLKRLKLTADKLAAVVDGIRSIAAQDEHLGRLESSMELSDELVLEKRTVPIGVLMIIFESRPDCLPQIAALAVKSGNGVILKGGKEALASNSLLHEILSTTIERASGGKVKSSVVGLIKGRTEIPTLLKLDQYIDLIIPRGSNTLVQYIKKNTHIPVMGHADGICHMFIDKSANAAMAIAATIDAKRDYPSACNALETLLLHKDIVDTGFADRLLRECRVAGITLRAGPVAHAAGLTSHLVDDMAKEYGDLTMAVEIVDSLADAVKHIHKYGSGHTDSIITEDKEAAETFLRSVDSACVFHNASTRFSDGYRFGLGAEVGISTGRIHARGPVGVDGLLTSKWVLRSTAKSGHTVGMFSKGEATYTHKVIN